MIILSSNAKDVASHYLSDKIFDCATLSGDLDAIDSALDTLSNALSIAFRDALLYSVKNVDILRPDDAHNLYIKVDVYNNGTLSANPMSGTIDLSDVNDWKYFKALLINNVDDAELAESDAFSEPFVGTQWVSPEQISAASVKYGGDGFAGYGPAYANAPVNIQFAEWLSASVLSDMTSDSTFFLKYEWYYVDDDKTRHVSDQFSMVVPGYAEVGAKAGAAASKADLAEVKQALETDVTTAAYVSESEIAVMDGASDIGITDYPTTGYYAQPFQCTILSAFADCDDKKVILQDYSEGKTYKLKFTVGSKDVKTSSSLMPSNEVMQFCCNYGYGPEAVDELNNAGLTFSAGKTYLIAVNLGMVQVIASR